MDWTTWALFAGLAFFALRYSWQTGMRPLGIGVVGNFAFTTLMWCSMSHRTFEMMQAAVNTFAEIGVMGAALMVLMRCPLQASIAIAISTISCIVSLSYSRTGDPLHRFAYEEIVNGLFAMNCMLVIFSGAIGVLVGRANNILRWRRHRRHAAHAHRRFRLEAAQARHDTD